MTATRSDFHSKIIFMISFGQRPDIEKMPQLYFFKIRFLKNMSKIDSNWKT